MAYIGPAPISVANGGTGAVTLTGLLVGSGTSALTAITWVPRTTFTPVLAFGGASVGITYTTQFAAYQRVGNVVNFKIYIVLSSKGSSTGNATITGLPVTSANDGAPGDLYMTTVNSALATTTSFMGEIGPNVTSVTLNGFNAATGATAALTDVQFANNSQIKITGSYFV